MTQFTLAVRVGTVTIKVEKLQGIRSQDQGGGNDVSEVSASSEGAKFNTNILEHSRHRHDLCNDSAREGGAREKRSDWPTLNRQTVRRLGTEIQNPGLDEQ